MLPILAAILQKAFNFYFERYKWVPDKVVQGGKRFTFTGPSGHAAFSEAFEYVLRDQARKPISSENFAAYREQRRRYYGLMVYSQGKGCRGVVVQYPAPPDHVIKVEEYTILYAINEAIKDISRTYQLQRNSLLHNILFVDVDGLEKHSPKAIKDFFLRHSNRPIILLSQTFCAEELKKFIESYELSSRPIICTGGFVPYVPVVDLCCDLFEARHQVNIRGRVDLVVSSEDERTMANQVFQWDPAKFDLTPDKTQLSMASSGSENPFQMLSSNPLPAITLNPAATPYLLMAFYLVMRYNRFDLIQHYTNSKLLGILQTEALPHLPATSPDVNATLSALIAQHTFMKNLILPGGDMANHSLLVQLDALAYKDKVLDKIRNDPVKIVFFDVDGTMLVPDNVPDNAATFTRGQFNGDLDSWVALLKKLNECGVICIALTQRAPVIGEQDHITAISLPEGKLYPYFAGLVKLGGMCVKAAAIVVLCALMKTKIEINLTLQTMPVDDQAPEKARIRENLTFRTMLVDDQLPEIEAARARNMPAFQMPLLSPSTPLENCGLPEALDDFLKGIPAPAPTSSPCP